MKSIAIYSRLLSVSALAVLLMFSVPAGAEPTTVEHLSQPDAAKPLEQPDLLSRMSKVFVKRFTFSGNTVFSSGDLGKLASSYENRELVVEELEQLRQELSLYYVNKGYLNSGVLIPDQNVVAGVIILTVIEGTLTRIEVEGLKHFRKEYITSRLENAAERPVNIGKLQEALQLLQQDARIKRIHAEMNPGAALGEGVLKVAVEEESPYLVALSSNNDASPSTGSYRGELNLAHRNLLGRGDTLAAGFGMTEGARDYHASYLLPLNSHDTTLELYYRKGDNRVTESLFRGLDIKSESDSYGLRVRQPISKTFSKEFTLSLAAEARASQTSLLNRGFSFSEGAEEGRSRESVLRFSQEWLQRTPSTVFAVHSTLSVGLALLGATVHGDSDTDGRFFSWLGQMVFIQKLGGLNSQLFFRGDVQLAHDGLLALEKFSVGGVNSVRGYRKDLLVRDNGVNGSVEIRVPALTGEQGFGELMIVPFIDFGGAWNNKKEAPETETIYSAGVGVRWELPRKLNLDLFYGYGLKALKDGGNDLQDRGIHFQLSWRVM